MKNENHILMMNNIENDLGYTGVGDRPSDRKTFLTMTLPKLVDENRRSGTENYHTIYYN